MDPVKAQENWWLFQTLEFAFGTLMQNLHIVAEHNNHADVKQSQHNEKQPHQLWTVWHKMTNKVKLIMSNIGLKNHIKGTVIVE